MTGTVEEQLLELSAATAFQIVSGALKGVGTALSDKNAIQQGMREYARNFLERYGQIKVLHMTEPIPLSEIYVSAQVISPRTIQSYKSIEELQAQFRQEGRRRLTQENSKFPKRNCLDLANEEQFLNVLGAPGAGKSTFLCRLGLEALRPRNTWDDAIQRKLGLRAGLPSTAYSQYTYEQLPVLVELRRFRTAEIDLFQHIRSELAICGLPDSEELTKTLLERGRLLILLDGVDEIPGERLEGAIAHIRDFVDRHSHNRYVTSCRTAFYKNYLRRFSDVLLADFDDQQISSFVNGWFRTDKDRQQDTAGELLRTLNDPANHSAKELATTPLLLTFLCLAFDETLRLPPNRSELYRQALEILLFRWSTSKRVHNEPVYRDLYARLEIGMLSDIAAPAFKEGRYFFNRKELIDRITAFLQNELNAPKKLNGDQVLEAIEVQQGLIVQRAQDAWSFSHLTLQEYLTAVWHEQNRKITDLLSNHLSDERWREVFILLAGVEGKADVLLTKMHEFAEKIAASSPSTLQILKWADTMATPAEEERITAARRAYAIAVLRDYAAISSVISALNEESIVDRVRLLTRTIDSERSYDRLRIRGLAIQLDANLQGILGQTTFLSRILERNRTIHDTVDIAALREFINESLTFLENLQTSGVLRGNWDGKIEQLRNLHRQAPSFSSPIEALKVWEATRDIYADVLTIPDTLRSWPGKEPSLDKYLYCCRLILECKNAATSIGRQSWEDICHNMIRAPRPLKKHPANDRAKN